MSVKYPLEMHIESLMSAELETDEVAELGRKVKESVSWMKQVAVNSISIHCVVLWHSLTTRKLPLYLKIELDGVV
ncbi:hypothetical protein NPIL_685071 [Nephila pilipes]|uniref:Uncharacterized protein n=1 Tax=Nephila pilipes TaxID=299642 RepID=A0A8X6PC70_NEPPI|nr:hypothetical protein NPIL_685071 [Nephila pilipes]